MNKKLKRVLAIIGIVFVLISIMSLTRVVALVTVLNVQSKQDVIVIIEEANNGNIEINIKSNNDTDSIHEDTTSNIGELLNEILKSLISFFISTPISSITFYVVCNPKKSD